MRNLDELFNEVLRRLNPTILIALYNLAMFFATADLRDTVMLYIAQNFYDAQFTLLQPYTFNHLMLISAFLIIAVKPTPLGAMLLSTPLTAYGAYAFFYARANGLSPSIVTSMIMGFIAVLVLVVTFYSIAKADQVRDAMKSRLIADDILISQLNQQVAELKGQEENAAAG